MKLYVLALGFYFAISFIVNFLRFLFVPRDLIFNTTAINVISLVEYAVLSFFFFRGIFIFLKFTMNPRPTKLDKGILSAPQNGLLKSATPTLLNF